MDTDELTMPGLAQEDVVETTGADRIPITDWAKEEEVGQQPTNTHLWEESWDDDDTTDDFSVQLK